MAYDDVYTQTLTGVSTSFSSTTTGPVDGYRAYAETVTNGMQTLINNDAFLQDKTSRLYSLPGQSATLVQVYANITSCFGDQDGSNTWEIRAYDTSALNCPPRIWAQMTITHPLWFPLPTLPPQCNIKNIYFHLMCPSAGSLPATMPICELMSRNTAAESEGTLITETTFIDHTTSLSAYQGIHAIKSENLNLLTAYATEYWIKFYKSSADPGAQILAIRIDLTRP